MASIEALVLGLKEGAVVRQSCRAVGTTRLRSRLREATPLVIEPSTVPMELLAAGNAKSSTENLTEDRHGKPGLQCNLV
jgi:hypothetical protein